jgi:hypothetical protein
MNRTGSDSIVDFVNIFRFQFVSLQKIARERLSLPLIHFYFLDLSADNRSVRVVHSRKLVNNVIPYFLDER